MFGIRIGLLIIIPFIFSHNNLLGQDHPYVHPNERVSLDTNSISVKVKPKSLQDFLRSGNFFGHARWYSMITNNSSNYSDYFANAIGVGIGYETGIYRNFQLGISGYAIYDVYSSDLTKIDQLSNQPNRYEVGLFDVLNPGNHDDLDRLEDLYIKYSLPSKGLIVKAGKQHIRTPFLNPQDGRMRPTLVQGILAEKKLGKIGLLQLGAIDRISPRSTVRWFSVGHSLGVYGVGVNPDGSKSQYAGNLPHSSVLYAGYTMKTNRGNLILWSQTVNKIFQTYLTQWDGKIGEKNRAWIYGIQGIHQHSLGNGGNVEINKAYFQPQNRSFVFGLRLGKQLNQNQRITLNGTRITGHGRYLMPREWGRDPFYTFMPRERNEGYGDVWAMNALYSYGFTEMPLKVDVGIGRYKLPNIYNFELNKYGFPAYYQANLDVRYSMEDFFEGLEIQFLIVLKQAIEQQGYLPKFEINKVNLTHYNLILNYHF